MREEAARHEQEMPSTSGVDAETRSAGFDLQSKLRSALQFWRDRKRGSCSNQASVGLGEGQTGKGVSGEEEECAVCQMSSLDAAS